MTRDQLAQSTRAVQDADRILSITANNVPSVPQVEQVSIGLDPAGRSGAVYFWRSDGTWEHIANATNIEFDVRRQEGYTVRNCYNCGQHNVIDYSDAQRSRQRLCDGCRDNRTRMERQRQGAGSDSLNEHLSNLALLETSDRVLAGPSSDEMEADYRV